MWGSEGGLIAFQRGRKLKHTSSALIQCDYDLNHRQLGRQEARWRRLTVRGVISLVSEKLLTHIITPSPLEKKKKKERSSICSHTATITAMFWGGGGGQVEGGQTERYNKEEPEHGVVRDSPKCSHSLF